MTPARGEVGLWGIVPAAGLSRRTGRPKQLLPFGQTDMTGAVTRTLLDAQLDGVVVVTRSELVDDLDLPHDTRLTLVLNDDSESEMIDSIRIGMDVLAGKRSQGAGMRMKGRYAAPSAANPLSSGGEDGVLVVPADMPAVTADHCRICIRAFLDDPRRIIVATYRGKRGHPMIFPFSMQPAVDRLDGGLRKLLDLYPDRLRTVEISDPGVTQDIDTLDDYLRSQR